MTMSHKTRMKISPIITHLKSYFKKEIKNIRHNAQFVETVQ